MEGRNRKAGLLAIVAGVLFIIGGSTGTTLWSTIGENVKLPYESIIFGTLILISSLGGILVILGGISFLKEKILIGKILIFFGASMGLIGMIIAIILAIKAEEYGSILVSQLSINGIAVILSIIGNAMAKKPKKK